MISEKGSLKVNHLEYSNECRILREISAASQVIFPGLDSTEHYSHLDLSLCVWEKWGADRKSYYTRFQKRDPAK